MSKEFKIYILHTRDEENKAKPDLLDSSPSCLYGKLSQEMLLPPKLLELIPQ